MFRPKVPIFNEAVNEGKRSSELCHRCAVIVPKFLH